MSKADLLVEIGTEELPPKALLTLSQCFGAEMENRLRNSGLQFGPVDTYATPRRLALIIRALERSQATQAVERRGPAITAAFAADGQPSQAALGFARSCGIGIDELARLKTEKGEWLVHRAQQAGRPTRDLLPEIINAALSALPIPKRMRWGARDEEFVRPVHWVVILHGEDVIPAEVLGIASGNETRGHRFMGTPHITLASPEEYVVRLAQEGRVLVDFAQRRARIEELTRVAAEALGCRAIFDAALMDEVTALVEWPAPIVGTFDAHFLQVPREALIATMQGNQKYFPLEAADGSLSNQFITISNIESLEPTLVRDGNERVIRPRLSDAAFFLEKDRKTSLVARTTQLGNIIFERRLGSILQKSERLVQLAARLAPLFGADVDEASRAALLSRCDLVTEMVGEFPELQGTMGRYYAAGDGELPQIAQALGEFYQPRYAGDAIPVTPIGRTIACADRLDTLIGIFSVGGAPTGDKDPYALRRAALGCLRICIEADASIDLKSALVCAAEGYGNEAADQVPIVLNFIFDRARGYLSGQGFEGSVVESVLCTHPNVPLDLVRRVAAVAAFTQMPEAITLSAANKRIANILRKTGSDQSPGNPSILCEPAEVALAQLVADTANRSADDLAHGNYTAYLQRLAALNEPINAFFDAVLVMAEDPALRSARLSLLRKIHGMFLRVADIGQVAA